MRFREVVVRIGYTLLGSLLTLCVMLVYDEYIADKLYKAKPVYTTLPGWKSDIRGIDKYDDLPKEAQEYVEFVEKELGVKISIVSNGPKRSEILYR